MKDFISIAHSVLCLLSCIAVGAAASPAQTRTTVPAPVAQHGFLYLPGIPGSATQSGFRGWHAVAGYRLEAERPATGSRLAAANPRLSPLAIQADLGVALPQLVVRCAGGRSVPYAILRMLRPGQRVPFLELRLDGVSVLSVGGTDQAEVGGGQVVEFGYQRLMLTQTDPVTGRRTSRTIDRLDQPFTRGKSLAMAAANAYQFETFVRVDGIPGSARRVGYTGWHQVQGYDIGVRRMSSTTARFDPLRLRSTLSALPQFTMALVTGQRLRNVEVHVWSSQVTTGPVLVMRLGEVVVTRAGSGVDGASDSQTVELTYKSVVFEYFTGGRGSRQGSTRGGWNQLTDTAL